MPQIFVELVVFAVESGRIKILLEPDEDRPGYRRLPWREWDGEEDFVHCVGLLADEVAPDRQMEPVFSHYFSMPTPRRGLAMTFLLSASPRGIVGGSRSAELADFAQPENLSHVYLTVLATALDRIRDLSDGTPLVAHMLDEEFTLTALQEATEALMGGVLDKRHFRRQLQEMSWLEETGNMSGGAHRPAKLYRVSKNRRTDRKKVA
jgi:hypothetical protein